MTIEFNIPNGIMKIDADTSFQEAARTKIRKMLKCFRDSDPEVEAVHKVKDWLQEKIDSERRRQKEFSAKYSHEENHFPMLDNYYRYLKTFCDDKEKLEQAAKDVRNCKLKMRTALIGMNKAEKLAERYKSILEDACRILK